jgi:hypothetical protein
VPPQFVQEACARVHRLPIVGHMLDATLRWLSVSLCTIVVLGFALFAVDEARGASEASQAGIAADASGSVAAPAPAASQEAARERAHGRVRETIDDAGDVVLGPFAAAAPAHGGAWAQRGIPTLLALAVYGFGLGYLARFARGRAR